MFLQRKCYQIFFHTWENRWVLLTSRPSPLCWSVSLKVPQFLYIYFHQHIEIEKFGKKHASTFKNYEKELLQCMGYSAIGREDVSEAFIPFSLSKIFMQIKSGNLSKIAWEYFHVIRGTTVVIPKFSDFPPFKSKFRNCKKNFVLKTSLNM